MVTDLGIIESILQKKPLVLEGEISNASGVYMLHLPGKESRGYRLDLPKKIQEKTLPGAYRIEGRVSLNERRDSIDAIEVVKLSALEPIELDSVSILIERNILLMELAGNDAKNEEWMKRLGDIKLLVRLLDDFFGRTYPREYRMVEDVLKRIKEIPPDPFDK